MSAVSSNSANFELQVSLYQSLTATLKDAGIALDPQEENDARLNALRFIIGANHDFYGARCNIIIDQLIDDLKRLAASGGKKAECEITFRLDLEVRALFRAKVVELSASNKSLTGNLNAISDLFEACKVKNDEKHERGEPVHFGGIPNDIVTFVPPESKT